MIRRVCGVTSTGYLSISAEGTVPQPGGAVGQMTLNSTAALQKAHRVLKVSESLDKILAISGDPYGDQNDGAEKTPTIYVMLMKLTK